MLNAPAASQCAQINEYVITSTHQSIWAPDLGTAHSQFIDGVHKRPMSAMTVFSCWQCGRNRVGLLPGSETARVTNSRRSYTSMTAAAVRHPYT